MIRRNKRYMVIHNRDKVVYPTSETSQLEPSLHDILVAYSRGEDVSQFIRVPATKATAEQQFTNRLAKVDFLTESEQYVRNAVNIANTFIKADKQKKQKSSAATSASASPSSPEESSSNS